MKIPAITITWAGLVLCASLGACGRDGERLQQVVTVTPNQGGVVGVAGICAEIPSGAVDETATLRAEVLEDVPHQMREGVHFTGEVYVLEGYEGRFKIPIRLELSYESSEVPENARVYPAYWNGAAWIQVAGETRGDQIAVETYHLSAWTTLIFDPLEWVTNPILSALHRICEVLFSHEKDIWKQALGDWETDEAIARVRMGDNPPRVEDLEKTGASVDEVTIGSKRYHVVPTNLPMLLSTETYSETERELWVQDDEGRWVKDEEIAFKALFAHECRRYFSPDRLSRQRSRFEQMADLLAQMNLWHGVAAGLDLVQSLLSEVLSHGATGAPYRPTELLREDYLLALEGTVCRTETQRFADELMELSQRFETVDLLQTSYEELSELYTGFTDSHHRGKPLIDFAKATFPGYEENYLVYTSKKVFRDFLDVVVATEAREYAHRAVDLRLSDDNAAYAATVAAVLRGVSDVRTGKTLADLVFHAFSVGGDNPLLTYYENVHQEADQYIGPWRIVSSIVYVMEVWRGPSLPETVGAPPKWAYRTESDVCSSPAVGSDGTVYFGSGDNYVGAEGGYVHALNPDGSLKWRYDTGGLTISSPSIGSDGTIYIGSSNGLIHALEPSGDLRWRYQTGAGVVSSPAIGSDGAIYVGSEDSCLYALDPDGALRWRYRTDGGIQSSPAVDAHGTICVTSWDGYAYAIDRRGNLKWSYEFGEGKTKTASSPAIGPDGTIYFGSSGGYHSCKDCEHHLYALNPDGSLKWRYLANNEVRASAVLGVDGTIYFASGSRVAGDDVGSVHALDQDGTLNWRYPIGRILSSPAVASDGTIYVASASADGFLYALSADGTLKSWYLATGWLGPSSPAIGPDGTVYAGLLNGTPNRGGLVAFDGWSSELAPSSWPKFHHDNQNTGRARAPEEPVSTAGKR